MPRPPDPAWFDQRAGDGRTLLVAEDVDGVVVGYTDLEADGHIDHAYCVPEVVGTGVGSMLYRALETEARAQGLTRLYVEASEAARRMYSAKGFTVVRRNDLEREGVAIHNFDLVKDLTVDGPAEGAAR